MGNNRHIWTNVSLPKSYTKMIKEMCNLSLYPSEHDCIVSLINDNVDLDMDFQDLIHDDIKKEKFKRVSLWISKDLRDYIFKYFIDTRIYTGLTDFVRDILRPYVIRWILSDKEKIEKRYKELIETDFMSKFVVKVKEKV